jgi:hypothetical protein
MLRFTIRDSLLLTAIAAGSWIDRNRLAPRAAPSDQWKFRAESLAERVQPDGWHVKLNHEEIRIMQIEATARDASWRRQN